MTPTAQHLLETIEKALPLLQLITEEEASAKPRPEKWSKKEILGHLIDSANNNQQKFVRTMLAEGPVQFVGYAQDQWVRIQGYQAANWQDIMDWWEQANRHLAHVIRQAPSQKSENTISIDGSAPFTLAFIMSDYVEHLKHHLKQILPDAGFSSAFENLY